MEILHIFAIVSVIALFVSFSFHFYIKPFPVLAVQLSILFTLIIFPLISMFLIFNRGEDIFFVPANNFTFADNPYIFFAPLPACILVAVLFVFIRKSRFAGFSIKSVLDLSKSKTEIISIIISLIAGGAWLSITMIFDKTSGSIGMIKITAYTLFGFAMYLISSFVIILTKVVISSSVGKLGS